MYADDIILISTSIGNAQAMLKIVTEFSKTHQIKFNPDKTCRVKGHNTYDFEL
jgi:hypothetical protein